MADGPGDGGGNARADSGGTWRPPSFAGLADVDLLVQQELSELKRLKRLSLGTAGGAPADPDLPSASEPAAEVSRQPSARRAPRPAQQRPPRPQFDVRGDDELWVPAGVHPELAPNEWRTFVEEKLAQIRNSQEQQQNQRAISRLSHEVADPDEYLDASDILDSKRRSSGGEKRRSILELSRDFVEEESPIYAPQAQFGATGLRRSTHRLRRPKPEVERPREPPREPAPSDSRRDSLLSDQLFTVKDGRPAGDLELSLRDFDLSDARAGGAGPKEDIEGLRAKPAATAANDAVGPSDSDADAAVERPAEWQARAPLIRADSPSPASASPASLAAAPSVGPAARPAAIMASAPVSAALSAAAPVVATPAAQFGARPGAPSTGDAWQATPLEAHPGASAGIAPGPTTPAPSSSAKTGPVLRPLNKSPFDPTFDASSEPLAGVSAAHSVGKTPQSAQSAPQPAASARTKELRAEKAGPEEQEKPRTDRRWRWFESSDEPRDKNEKEAKETKDMKDMKDKDRLGSSTIARLFKKKEKKSTRKKGADDDAKEDAESSADARAAHESGERAADAANASDASESRHSRSRPLSRELKLSDDQKWSDAYPRHKGEPRPGDTGAELRGPFDRVDLPEALRTRPGGHSRNMSRPANLADKPVAGGLTLGAATAQARSPSPPSPRSPGSPPSPSSPLNPAREMPVSRLGGAPGAAAAQRTLRPRTPDARGRGIPKPQSHQQHQQHQQPRGPRRPKGMSRARKPGRESPAPQTSPATAPSSPAAASANGAAAQPSAPEIKLPYDIPAHQVSDKSQVMMYHRFPLHIERAIYRLSHMKLANPRRPLRQQVLLSNFMYSYLHLINYVYHQQQLAQMQEQQEQQEPGSVHMVAGHAYDGGDFPKDESSSEDDVSEEGLVR